MGSTASISANGSSMFTAQMCESYLGPDFDADLFDALKDEDGYVSTEQIIFERDKRQAGLQKTVLNS
jgi:hypothetical protein